MALLTTPSDTARMPRIHGAANTGRVDIVNTVITDNDCDVNEDYHGLRPLDLAINGQHLDIVKILIDNGAQIGYLGSDRYSPLFRAILTKNLAFVEAILDADPSLNRDLHVINSPLHFAVSSRAPLAIIEKLIDAGFDANAPGRDGESCLTAACRNTDIETVRYFLDKTTVIEDAAAGSLPLIAAAQSGRIETVKLLLDKGCSVDLRDEQQCTALHKAAGRGSADIVSLLLAHGSDADVVDAKGMTPVICALSPHTDNAVDVIAPLLDAGCDVDARDANGNTALCLAAEQGNAECVTLMLGHGANADVCGADDQLPIRHALANGHIDVAEKLVHHTSDFSDAGWLLRVAVRNDSCDLVDILLTQSRQFDTDENGCTPLFQACIDGRTRIVRKLLDGGIDVNHRNNAGLTALFEATRRGHADIVNLLIAAGADMNARDRFGNNPFVYAVLEGKSDVVEAFIESGSDVNEGYQNGYTPLFFACEKGWKNIVRILIDAGAEVNRRSSTGLTPIHRSIDLHPDTQIIELLITHDADIDCLDHSGVAPLHTAVRSGNSAVLSCLIENGADLNICTEQSASPLIWAAELGNYEMARLLLEAGCDPYVRRRDRLTAAQIAVMKSESFAECNHSFTRFMKHYDPEREPLFALLDKHTNFAWVTLQNIGNLVTSRFRRTN